MGITINKYKVTVFVLQVMIILMVTACNGEKRSVDISRNADGSKIFRNKIELFRDYAFCSCLEYSYKKDSIQIRDDSRATLYDLSNDELMINKRGQQIDSFARGYVDRIDARPGQTYEGRKSRSFDCLMFFKSNKLLRFLKTLK